MKKTFTILMTVLLLIAMAVPVLATDSAQMTVSASQSTVNPGDTVEFTVSISQVDDCRSGGFVISYDPAVFEYVSGQCVVSGVTMSDFSGGTGVFAFSEGAGISGSIFRFTLKVRDDAPTGSAMVSGTPSIRTGAGQISCGVSGSGITVSCVHTYGSWDEAEDGHRRTCSKCGGTDTAAHSWDAGTVTQFPTCREEGSKTVTCTVCGATAVKTIDKSSDHTWGGCEAVDGSTHKHTCTVCGTENVSGHSWNSGSTTKSPSCMETGIKTYTCTACGTTTDETIAKTNDHTWSGYVNISGNSHKRTCSVCGKEDTSGHSWGSGRITKAATCKDSGSMTYTCSACGTTTMESMEKSSVHTYDHDCDPDCGLCGAVREIAHVYDTAWTQDETAHWHGCTVCGEPDEQIVHEYENDCAALCLTCGYTREIAHHYGDTWLADENGHWQACILCGTDTDAFLHIPGPEATEDMAQVCTVCAWELSPARGHSFAEIWNSDEENHWHECACGVKADTAAHTWDEGNENEDRSVTYACTVCGAQRIVAPQGISPAETVLLVVALTAIGGVVTVFAFRKKKT